MKTDGYTKVDWLTTVVVVVATWVAFFVSIGFMARVAKELFCVGFGC